MSKQNQGALSSNTVQEKLSQGLAANKNNNRSRYVASRLPARGAGVASKATPATPYKNNHEKHLHVYFQYLMGLQYLLYHYNFQMLLHLLMSNLQEVPLYL